MPPFSAFIVFRVLIGSFVFAHHISSQFVNLSNEMLISYVIPSVVLLSFSSLNRYESKLSGFIYEHCHLNL